MPQLSRVWFHRSRAILWAIGGILSFPLGWANAVWFVTVASIYANVESGWATSEAADNTAVLRRLDELHRAISHRKARRTPLGPRNTHGHRPSRALRNARQVSRGHVHSRQL